MHAIVLGVYDSGESSEVAHVLSAEHGPLSVMAKGARRAKSQVAAALQPLALTEMTVHMHEDADIVTLREAATLHAHPEFAAQPKRLACGAVLAEVAAACCIAHQPAREMVELVVRGLDELAAAALELIDARTALWLLRILAASGHSPAIDPAVLTHRSSPKPRVFWLEISRGRVTLDGSQPLREPTWPLFAAREDFFPLPPEAVRLLHSCGGMAEETAASNLGAALAQQFVRGLMLHTEHHLDRRLRSARFWNSVARGTGSPGSMDQG